MASVVLTPGLVESIGDLVMLWWNDPEYAAVEDDFNYAVALGGQDAGSSETLRATTFGASIPSDAIIAGIVLSIDRNSSVASLFKDYTIFLRKAGGQAGNDKADLSTFYPLVDTTVTYGTSADLWGAAWSPADINDIGFGVDIEVQKIAGGGGGPKAASIDAVWLEVFYDVPPSPSGPFTLTATTFDEDQIDLAWTDVFTTEDGFKIERSLTGVGSWTQIDTAAADATTYSSTGLDPATTYYYRVRAYNDGGDSDYSNTANDTTDFYAPTLLTATAVYASQIDLAWTDNSAVEDGYKIERSLTGAGGWSVITTTAADATSYSDDTCVPGTTYYYRTRAYKSAIFSAYSNTASATTALRLLWNPWPLGSMSGAVRGPLGA